MGESSSSLQTSVFNKNIVGGWALSHPAVCILPVWLTAAVPADVTFPLSSFVTSWKTVTSFSSPHCSCNPPTPSLKLQHNEPLNSDFCPILPRLAPRLVPPPPVSEWGRGWRRRSQNRERYEGQLY